MASGFGLLPSMTPTTTQQRAPNARLPVRDVINDLAVLELRAAIAGEVQFVSPRAAATLLQLSRAAGAPAAYPRSLQEIHSGPGPMSRFFTGAQDNRSAEEIARTRQIHQSRNIFGLDDLPQLLDQLGSSGSSGNAGKHERAKSYRPRLENAAAELRVFLADTRTNAEALDRFRTIARSIEADVEDQHVLDSPESQLDTADYNHIMEALRTMFRRVPSEPGYGS